MKAEIEIENLHEKLDELRDKKWAELVGAGQQFAGLMQPSWRRGEIGFCCFLVNNWWKKI